MSDSVDSKAEAASKKWEAIQKKAFTHWVNSMLKRRDLSIEVLEEGFVSGVNLINLLEILTGKRIEQKWSKKPQLRVHKITNCFIALTFLREQGVNFFSLFIFNYHQFSLFLIFFFFYFYHHLTLWTLSHFT